MTEKYLEEILKLHKSKGLLEEANQLIQIQQQPFSLNVFTLRLKKVNPSNLDIAFYRAQILKRIKSDSQLYKEIKEFSLVFRFFEKLKIKNGYIQKSETPDFVLERNKRKYGIEVTRIYAGNDWVAEKLHNDIVAYRLRDKKLSEYIYFKKFDGKIKTYNHHNKIMVKAVKEKAFRKEEITQIKNKIFEKIRKQIDDYTKYDFNFIFAEIVFTDYEGLDQFEKLNQEIKFFISHLDVIWGAPEFHLILKVGNTWNDFNLKNGIYRSL